MTALNKVVVIGLSIAVFMCLLYVVVMTFASSIQVTPQHILSSSATSSRPPTKEHTKPTPPRPHNILYLIQTEQCIPPYFQLNDVFGIPNSGFEVIVLSYKEACLDSSMPHVQYLLDNRTTWTTGRNVLFEAAMNRSQTYLYYVFMDDDFALWDHKKQLMGPWRRFESSSYDPTFDQQTWWASQMSVIIRSEVLFRGQVVLHVELFGDNSKHRPYPRDSTSLKLCYTI